MTPSRLALFCEKFIQAGWLVALIVTPLYFNIYSSRVFEPDKISLLRTLALAMGAAWLILRAERWRGRSGTRDAAASHSVIERVKEWARAASQRNPLTIPALLIWLAYLISTLLSVSPTVSFFGSYQRLQGLYTFSSYIIIFFLAASLIETRADVERAVSIALVASFPAALYGIVQHYFLDALPWVGDVTTRVASTVGNSIFIGAFLVLAIPLALARLIQTAERAKTAIAGRARVWLYPAAIATLILIAAVWALSFDLGAKEIIEANYSGTLTPEQLQLASSAFNLALLGTLVVVTLWWGAALVLKQRAANFLLIALYAALLAVQCVALLFSQSRGPLFGILGGMFTFGVLFALVRGARKLALGAASAAALVMILLALINIPGSPLAPLRVLPYVGRLGRVFELEGGTGRVRVLIWQGALKLVLPHEPLWAPTTGEDLFNPLRPLVGYGPESMYVAYNKFYPPELGTLESRNATPDRSHNETFDALVTTGLFGFVAENVLFLVILYLALKWLGLIPSPRARNIFIALWFGGGALLALLFGFVLGWEFIGVALPGGMILGLFAYLVAFALRSRRSNGRSLPSDVQSTTSRRFTETSLPSNFQLPTSSLWLIALAALFVAHFIEIHFGIAIVSTRTYFWFFAAVFVALGARGIPMPEHAEPAESKESVSAPPPLTPPARKRNTQTPVQKPAARSNPARARRVSTSPLITFAFLVGLVLAVMGFDYISTNNLAAAGTDSISGLDIVISALTVKATTIGGMTSYALLWLFITTLLVGMGVGIAEWGRTFHLSARDWGVAALLFAVLAFAIFSGLAFYHVLLIATSRSGILDALLVSVVIFTAFVLLMVAVCAVTMLFDEPMPHLWVRRTTNWVVMPVLVLIAGVLITATNLDPVRADILYKQAAALPPENADKAIEFYQRALALQPQQDFYYLFLGRAYLDAAKIQADAAARAQVLQRAVEALNVARSINPYNTDHSANLARLAQARGALDESFAAKRDAYKQASAYFDQATRLSPNTAHLYDQHAQALLEYEALLQENQDVTGAAQAHQQALAQIARALQIDPTFCLTYGMRAQAQDNWRARTGDALETLRRAPQCGDVFIGEGMAIAVNALAQAGDEALAAKEGAAFEQMLQAAVKATPSLELYTTLANYYSRAGRIPEALAAIDGALANMPQADSTTRKRYEDFRFTLVQLREALDAVQAAPNDPEAHRAVANQWLARGQIDFALPEFVKVLELKSDDYSARRNVALLLIAKDQLTQAAQSIRQLQPVAPASDQTLWQRLDLILTALSSGDTNQALTQLEELAKQADKQDYALVSALRLLATKLGAAG
ncbi:MAG: O-antigen ligase family protein [Chloroflexi bacterium]|nr:O-antigen ligase family protein [Chloroflexota bacterium]